MSDEPEIVQVGNEQIEVWPRYCVYPPDKRNCLQCWLDGKILCSPRHRATATMSKEDKVATAKEAKERGVKVVAKEQRIPMAIVRAWVGAYARGSKQSHGPSGQDPDSPRCAICNRKLRPARRTRMPQGQYCSRCTIHVLPFLRKGICPECKGHLSAEPWGIPRKSVQVRELVCESCGKRWPALDETPPGNDQGTAVPPPDSGGSSHLTVPVPLSDSGGSNVDHQDGLSAATLQQRIDHLDGKIGELQREHDYLEIEITHYQSLLLHYKRVRDAEAYGFEYDPEKDNIDYK